MLLAADAAYPFDLALLPPGVTAVLGYVGQSGATPHLWSVAEIMAVQQRGYQWWPIWTVPQRALRGQDGTDAAGGMASALTGRGYPQGGPVFLDVEHSAYAADPVGAVDCALSWQHGMAWRGWPAAYWYSSLGAPCDWVADWTGTRPTSLPVGKIGVQYDHALAGDAYDLSVFDDHLATLLGGNTMTLTGADIDAVFSHGMANPASHLVESLSQRICETQADAAAAKAQAANVAAELAAARADIAALTGLVKELSLSAGATPGQILDAMATRLAQ